MIGLDDTIVPSLMFHSVGLQDSDWCWANLSESVAIFEHKLKVIRDRGFSTVFWNEVYEHVADRQQLSQPSVMLTFDDGYLDNWVLVWPLLKRYGARATVFVSTDFIEPDGPPRPTLQDVWSGRAEENSLDVAGFLRPSEMRAMFDSGLVDIQSHASTHTWLFTGNRLIDVYRSAEYRKYPWMAWNARPERKPFYMTEDQSTFVPEGEPVFEHAQAIRARRFTPDPAAVEEFRRGWSDSEGNAEDASAHMTRARALERKLGFESGWPGKIETIEERACRIGAELDRNRETLRMIVGRAPDFLAWPGGAYDELAVQIAHERGFKAYTLGSRDRKWRRNRPGEDPASLRRIQTTSKLNVRGVFCGIQDGQFQMLLIQQHRGSIFHRIALYAYKTRALFKAFLSGLSK